jgi:putative ABC transport system permease protein
MPPDLRYALRSLKGRPLFSFVLISILAIGLGANSAMFSIVDSVLLEPLPFPEADQLVWMWGLTPDGGQNTLSALDYMDYREQSSTFEHLAAYSIWQERYVVTGSDRPEVLVGAATSWNFFRALGVEPILGRGFVLEDEDPSFGNPVVLSHALWQRRFGRDPEILGQTVSLEGNAYEVVGVMPKGFAFPSWAELWRPMRMSESLAQGRGNNNFRIFGRLTSTASLEQADAEMVALHTGLAEEFPNEKEGWSVALVPLEDIFVGGVRNVLWVLLGAVVLVLLVACANVAALLLGRADGRQSEMAIRLTLGASPGRVTRQMLTESVVTALIGGTVGILFAAAVLRALSRMGIEALPRQATIEFDQTALFFTLVVSMASGILFGLAPALRAHRVPLAEALKDGHRGNRGPAGSRLHSGLVVGQVALSLILLVGSALLIRSFMTLRSEELGFSPEGVLTADVQLSEAEYGDEKVHPYLFYQSALERMRALPGVEGAGVTTRLPVEGGFGPYNGVYPEGRPPASRAEMVPAVRRVISPGYFEAMDIPLLRGRTLTHNDMADGPLVAVISRSLAEALFPGQDPIGRSVVYPWSPPVSFEVVGVVGDVRLGDLDDDLFSTIYWSLGQHTRLNAKLVVKTSGEPSALAPALRVALQEIGPNVPVSAIRPMTDVVSSSLEQNRFRTLVFGAFAVVAILLAALGLYGVLAQLVGRRTHEIGVRVVLGAGRTDILNRVLGQGMRLTLAGLALGLAGAAATTRFLKGMLFGVESLDPVTFVGATVLLAMTALAAALLPAWRATRVDPVDCLRSE